MAERDNDGAVSCARAANSQVQALATLVVCVGVETCCANCRWGLKAAATKALVVARLLFDDFEAEFFDDGVGEDVFGDLFDLGFGVFAA